jgi:ABC-type glutathione transport system ATPase component
MEYQDKKLYLIRGVSGAGKSTFARSICGVVFEADQYFMDSHGKYTFDGSKIKKAHEWCRSEVETAMILNHTCGINSEIAVSNTFTQEWEMEHYYKLAEQYGYRVFSVIVENRHGGINEHGVPEDKVQIMKDRFEVKL